MCINHGPSAPITLYMKRLIAQFLALAWVFGIHQEFFVRSEERIEADALDQMKI